MCEPTPKRIRKVPTHLHLGHFYLKMKQTNRNAIIILVRRRAANFKRARSAEKNYKLLLIDNWFMGQYNERITPMVAVVTQYWSKKEPYNLAEIMHMYEDI